jgi:acyl carrier protein
MKEKIIEIISEIVRVDSDYVRSKPNSVGLNITKGWDSLAQLSIMTAIEDEFDIEMSIEEMEELDLAQKIIDRFS